MSLKTRTPLTDKPLRNPGQSVEEKLSELAYDRVLTPSLIAVFLLVLAAMEWWRQYSGMRPSPMLFSAIASLTAAYAVFRVVKTLPELKMLRLARDGERVVGQFLERLRERGYQVFHDVVGEGFNVDHVLIGPSGVFTVETKTRSKPARGESKIHFDGQTVRVAGFEPDRDPVVQAKAQVAWLRELLVESTGQKFPVRPIILFPGWFVEQIKGSTRDLWVLNPKALPDFIDHEPKILSESEIKLASFHLSRFIRSNTALA